MTPSARVKATIEIFERLDTGRVPMDAIVGDYMRQRRYIGSKDRANIADRAYNIVRAQARITWWLDMAHMEDTARNRVLTFSALSESMDIHDLFDGTKYGPESLDQREKSYVKKLKDLGLNCADMPENVLVECPPQYEERLRAVFGDDFVPEMQAMMEGASLDMRVNIWRSDREKAMESLKESGIRTDETEISPWGLRARDKVFLSKSKAYLKGWVEIQDEGSQLIAHVCDVKPGMQVLDYCAGGGGKTLALAAAMQNKGRIVAADIDGRRLEKSRPRFKKGGVADIIEVRPLSDEKNRKWLRRQKESFDVVLTDVPCSGTGTWRRNPDMRWREYGPSLDELVAIQAEILEKVAKCVKTGGKLVYATCSLLPEENEGQIETFLKAHPEFSVEAIDPARGIGSPYMRLSPYRNKTDGFFAAVLKRSDETFITPKKSRDDEESDD